MFIIGFILPKNQRRGASRGKRPILTQGPDSADKHFTRSKMAFKKISNTRLNFMHFMYFHGAVRNIQFIRLQWEKTPTTRWNEEANSSALTIAWPASDCRKTAETARAPPSGCCRAQGHTVQSCDTWWPFYALHLTLFSCCFQIPVAFALIPR